MSQDIVLKAEVRERVGKGAARALRREDKIPAVIYGDKQPPIPIALPYKETFQYLHAGGFLTTLAKIEVNGETIQTLPRDYQLDPVRDHLVHVDFLRVKKGSRITVEIPVQIINEEDSPGLKRGGVINFVRYSVEVECPFDAIPDQLICDVAGLDINDSVHISAIDLPEGVEPTIRDRDFTVITIASSAGRKQELAEAAAEAEEAEGLFAEEGEIDGEGEGEGEGGEEQPTEEE